MFGGVQVKGSAGVSGDPIGLYDYGGATASSSMTPAAAAAAPPYVFGATAATPVATPGVFCQLHLFCFRSRRSRTKKRSMKIMVDRKPKFDPLMNGGSTTTAAATVPAIGLSPATQQKILAVSPEQLQAKAYQQRMMQQQQRPGGTVMPGMMMPPFSWPDMGAAASPGFSNAPAAVKKDDKKFDFV
jgi:hypothetical protein